MTSLKLNWIKCQGDVWCSFQNLNIDHEFFDHFNGVYIIWEDQKVIKIAGGNIRTCIKEDRNSPDLVVHYPKAKVTYAKVSESDRQGVISFLSNQFKVTQPSTIPASEQIEVNFPWWQA